MVIKNSKDLLEGKRSIYDKKVYRRDEKVMDRLAVKIGQSIKESREKNNMTQLKLAVKADISRNYISDIECGRYIPSVKKLIVLSNILNIDLNLIKNDGNTRRNY